MLTASQARLSEDIPVSIVIPTRDRPEELHACLASLVAQVTTRPVEIIVGDNNPSSGLTAAVVAEFSQVKVVPEYRSGASYARNAAICASSGEIIAMLDDDMTAPSDWLENILSPFNRPDVAAVAGNVLPLELETESQRLFQSYGIGGLTRGQHSWNADAAWFAAHKTRAVRTWMIGCSGNAAFRSSIFSDPRIGMLEETMGPGSGAGCAEDMHLFYKILAAGKTIFYNPESFTWHRHRRSMEDLRHQLFDYSKGSIAFQLNTLLHYRDCRALSEMLFWIPAWSCYRILERLLGANSYPVSLILYELWGNLIGPFTLWRSCRRVRRLGRSSAYVPPALRGVRQLQEVS